ncbi:MAG: AsmA-like C-terminal domain-containing protein [Desulfobacterales bacterium]|nr:AsmA-like C-terminal domain-containing protein [Desulfobacterales bacterium]
MPKHRKIWVTLISLAAVFLSLLIVLVVAIPQLINLETVKQEVKRLYAKDLGGTIEYQRLKMALFPRPHVVISDVRFTVPDNVEGTVDTLKIYPKILPLITGDIEIKVVYSRSPKISVQFAETMITPKTDEKPFSFETLVDNIKMITDAIPELKIPSIAVTVRNGRVNFFKGQQRFLALQGVTSQIKHRGASIEFSAQCQSNFWEDISIEGRYTESGFKLNSRIQLNQFRPHAVVEYLYPAPSLKMTNARANLTMNLMADGPHNLQADIDASIPYMYWQLKDKELRINDTHLQARFQLKDENLSLTLERLDLSEPRLSMSGQLKIDPRQPAVQLALEGRQINVAKAQKIALALTENAETVSNIFSILRDGDFERVTLRGEAPNWAQMADLQKVVIQGKLVGGKISIPVGSLELENVTGDATIANGILTGENAEAQMGASFAKNGKLSIPLTKATAPFHIEALVQADLSQLPSVLARLIDDKEFQKELKRFKKFEGNAQGMLVIGEDLRDTRVKVMASDFTVNADYQRIPYPVTVKGGSFVLDGTQIALTNCDVRFGKSSLSGLSTRFGWQKASLLEASSASAHIDLPQLHAWLVQMQTFEKDLKKIESIEGALLLQNLSLNGPLFKPARWQVTSNGVIQNLILSSAEIPGPLTIVQGRFSCQKKQLKIKKLNTQIGQSIFSGLDINLSWGKTTTLTAKAEASVVNLDEVYAWLKHHQTLKNHVKDVPVLSGNLAFSGLAFDGPISNRSDLKTTFSAAIEKWHIRSAEFPTDIELSGGELSWRRSRFDILQTHARFGTSTIRRLSFGKQWGEIPLTELAADSADIQIAELYPWLVSFETLNKMFKGYQATQGKLMLTDVNFKGPVGTAKSWQFHLSGDITDLEWTSDFFKSPILVKTVDFVAKDTPGAAGLSGRVDLSAVQIEWEKSQIHLQGGAAFTEDRLSLEMQLTADQLDWRQIDQITSVEKSTAADEKLELRGGLGVELDTFTYNGFTWRPVQADITFGETDTRIVIREADLCGIRFPGILKVSGEALELYFNPSAKDQDLEKSLACLFEKPNLMAGNYNLSGELMAKARPSEFPKSLTGNLEFSSLEGRIYRFGMLAKIFALLNVTEIYRGEVPDLKGKGFAYNSMTANGTFEDGKLIISDTSIDSPSMGIAIEGDIDLIKNKVNLVVLVAPFKTVDRIVKNIPLVSNILGGNLISIPFRAIGDLGDPDVIPLSPTAVGSGLLGILERTIKLPITIIQPVLPDKKEESSPKEKKSPGTSP